jgi:steroid delta-isomerase-like uncharacterized protein
MTRDEIIALFVKRQEYWRLHDAHALAANHTEDGMVVSPLFGTVRGRAAIEKTYFELFQVFDDFALVSDEIVIDGDRAAQIFRVQASHTHELFGFPGTGKKFELQGVFFFRFEHGHIAFEQRFYDFTGVLLQLGILKAKP